MAGYLAGDVDKWIYIDIGQSEAYAVSLKK